MSVEDEAYTEDEEKPQKENRAQRRANEKKGRRPQRSSKLDNANLDKVYNPDTQYSNPGDPPGESRFDQVYGSGALDGMLGSDLFKKELATLRDEQNAFIAWQAKQDDYIIYQNVDFDDKEGKDVWEPVTYSYYPLTVGQRLALQKLESEANGIQRAMNTGGTVERAVTDRLNREASQKAGKPVFKTIDEWQYEKTYELLQEQCARYLRMEVDKEFESSNYADVVLALTAAKYAELHVPKFQKTRMSSDSSKEKKSSGIA